MVFQPPVVRSATPVVRHNFKSIDELLSPLPNSLTSTPSQRNGKADFRTPLFQLASGKCDQLPPYARRTTARRSPMHSNSSLDDTGYSSQYLSGSLLSLRQSRESIDSHENDDDLENMRPTTSSSPISDMNKSNQTAVSIHIGSLRSRARSSVRLEEEQQIEEDPHGLHRSSEDESGPILRNQPLPGSNANGVTVKPAVARRESHPCLVPEQAITRKESSSATNVGPPTRESNSSDGHVATIRLIARLLPLEMTRRKSPLLFYSVPAVFCIKLFSCNK